MNNTKADLRIHATTVNVKQLVQLRHFVQDSSDSSQKKNRLLFSGAQTSRFRGRGMDFDEVRHYQAGDEIRRMDWRVTARTGKPHTKLYREERERPVYIVIDYNPSMYFGTKVAFKSVIAAQAGAYTAWLHSHLGDRVGGVLIAGNKPIELRPQISTRGVLPLIKEIVTHTNTQTRQPLTTQHFTDALLRLRRYVKPGSQIILFSDFYHYNDDIYHHLLSLAEIATLRIGFIYDILEKEPPPPNYYAVTDGHQTLAFDTRDSDFCVDYRKSFQQRYEALHSLCARHHLSFIPLTTECFVPKAIQNHFHKHKTRRYE